MYSLISFLSVCFPTAEVYIDPWVSLVEGLAFCSFFLLLCDYVCPNINQRELFFATKKTSGVKWFRIRWLMVFQMPIVALIVSIATDVTAAVGIYCRWSFMPHFAKFWLRLIQIISLVTAVLSILQFYHLLKTDLTQRRPLLKLIAFKIIVFLNFVQGILFWVLTDIGVLKETDTLTFADLHIGIPNLLICIEMAPLSLFFLWVYSWRVYVKNSHGSYVTMDRPGQRPRLYQGGPIGVHAWLTMIKPSGIIESILVVSGRSGPPTDSLGQDDRVDNQPLNPNRSFQVKCYQDEYPYISSKIQNQQLYPLEVN
ncbi:organic solute transporter Ostalpha-domain-containing protein [Fusarium oxysporum]|nr:organic solute transporter Ostalpha-domain-containing protein [Fusarium oxysporum]